MIFYFTATGNSLYAAKAFQEKLGGELLSIPELMREERTTFQTTAADYVGLAFPVFFWGLPAIIRRFLSQLEIEGALPEKTFICATMGGTSGSACEAAQKLLLKQGVRVGYKFGLKMPDNYVPVYTMPTQEEAQHQLDATDLELSHATDLLLQGKPGDYNKRKGPAPVLSPLAYKAYPRSTRKFYADEACNGCTLCQKICPVGAIQMEEGKPRWIKDQCETCLACLQRCPTQAIQRGKDSRRKGRYVNPRLSPQELP